MWQSDREHDRSGRCEGGKGGAREGREEEKKLRGWRAPSSSPSLVRIIKRKEFGELKREVLQLPCFETKPLLLWPTWAAVKGGICMRFVFQVARCGFKGDVEEGERIECPAEVGEEPQPSTEV